MIRYLFIVNFIALCFSCQKNRHTNEQCDNAELCVGNRTQDTIFYGWNTNLLEDTLLPGKSACLLVGELDIEYNKISGKKKNEPSYTIMITTSPAGSWFVEIAECHKRSNFEYDPGNTNSIKLYDE
ncbi:MAG: hypothetical protein SGJ15_04860 [Bacteroidota bacterium]|nr:hypothetical protein [Bacteroidota bacterium]